MKKFIYLLGAALLFAVLLSCVRTLTPAVEKVRKSKNFDTASFNYVFVEGVKQKVIGNTGEALKLLEQALLINPESDAAYYQIAQIVINSGDLKNGKKFALKANELQDGNLWYIMMLAGIYYQQKDLDSTVYYYEKAVNYFPEKMDLQFALGNLYSENKSFDRAEKLFNSMDEKFGTSEESTVSAIKNLVAAKRYDEALERARILVREFPDKILYTGILAEIYRGKGERELAMDVYNRLLDNNPDDAQIQLSLCDFLIEEKNYDDLFLLLNRVIINSNVSREDKISLMAKLMESPDIISKYGERVMVSVMVLEAEYKDDDVMPLLKADLLIKQDKLEQAAIKLEEIITKREENYYAWERLLLVYLQLKEYDKLVSRGEECAKRFNRSFVAKILYANGALETGNYPVAIEELRKAEILAGDNKDFKNQVLTMRADVYYRMKDYENAFKIFDEALRNNSEDLTIMNNYAYYLAEQNMKLKEAEEMARNVISKAGDNTTFLDTYAWVLYKRGKYREAEKVMESIIITGEKPDAEWYEHYGFILKKLANCTKAVEIWDTAIKLDPSKEYLFNEIENCEK